MELWPKDWGSNWVRKAVGTKLRFALSVAVVVAYLLFVHFTRYHWIYDGVNFPALLLGAILIIAFFAMRGSFKKAHRSESSNS
jgi:uncharacterized membrane protein